MSDKSILMATESALDRTLKLLDEESRARRVAEVKLKFATDRVLRLKERLKSSEGNIKC